MWVRVWIGKICWGWIEKVAGWWWWLVKKYVGAGMDREDMLGMD
jgi:hypothetical protein